MGGAVGEGMEAVERLGKCGRRVNWGINNRGAGFIGEPRRTFGDFVHISVALRQRFAFAAHTWAVMSSEKA